MDEKINIFLKCNIILIGAVLLISSFSAIAIEYNEKDKDMMNFSFSFDAPVIEKVTVENIVYDRVILKGASSLGDFGEPVLPVKEIKVLIPYEYNVGDISINTGKIVKIGSNFLVEPGKKEQTFSQKTSISSYNKNNDIYTSENQYPGKLIEKVGTYCFRGYQILILTIHPVQYKPATGEIFYYDSIDISIEVIKDTKLSINQLFRGVEKDKTEIIKKIDNPEILNTYPDANIELIDSYDLLIITIDDFKADFESLGHIHELRGISTIVKTLSDIGSNDPADIRNFTRDAYNDWGIEYVLIGGDFDIVPARMLWVSSGVGAYTDMPSDLYYACLDGPYNYDGDDKWGEPRDGEDGGDVDLIAEVYIGRACVGNSLEVDHFIYKTASYIHTDDPYQDDVIMVGELLWDPPPTWGGDYMDELINGTNAHGYTTVGFDPEVYNIETLYDRDWVDNDWPKSEIIDRINNNIHIINHLGHSWYNYNMKMNNDNAYNLTNDKFCFMYSQGCDNGGFDDPYGYDCIAEYFTIKTDHGAFATVANARSGWGVVGSTDGASHRYHREFWDAIFNESIIQLSKANQDSKEDNLYRINGNCMRWCYYQLNLLGDPTLDFFNHETNLPPAKPGAPTGPTDGEVGVEYTYKTTAITDPDGDETYYKFYWGDEESSEWLGPFNGGEEISESHIWTKKGNYEVKVRCRDLIWGMSEYSDPLTVEIDGPFLEIGEIKGGLLKASGEIKNVGAGIASNVKRSITVRGGILNKILIVTNSTIDKLDPGVVTIAETDKSIWGLGNVKITVVTSAPGVSHISKTVDGYVFLFFVIIK